MDSRFKQQSVFPTPEEKRREAVSVGMLRVTPQIGRQVTTENISNMGLLIT